MPDTTRPASSHQLPLEPGGEVEILLTSSSVRVRGVDDDHVSIRAQDGEEELDGFIAVEQSAGRVVIRDAEREMRLGPIRLAARGAPDLDIDVPMTARVMCRTVSGDVEATGVGGDSRWASASGDMRIGVVGGGVHAVDSMSGDVLLEATGAVTVRGRTVSGDLRVRAPRIEHLALSTTSGDIRVAGELGGAGEHEVTSVSGDVEIATPSPVRVTTQTIAGDVRASGSYVADGGRGRRTLVAGNGSVALRIRTTSGDIRLRADAPAAPVPPEPPLAPVPPVMDPPAPAAPPASAAPVPFEPPYVVAEAEAAPNLVRLPSDRPAGEGETAVGSDDEPGTAAPGEPWLGEAGVTDRREAARLDILRALERGELDIEAASRRLEHLEAAGPRYFRGWC